MLSESTSAKAFKQCWRNHSEHNLTAVANVSAGCCSPLHHGVIVLHFITVSQNIHHLQPMPSTFESTVPAHMAHDHGWRELIRVENHYYSVVLLRLIAVNASPYTPSHLALHGMLGWLTCTAKCSIAAFASSFWKSLATLLCTDVTRSPRLLAAAILSISPHGEEPNGEMG
jgi:hypothetical protein